VVLPASGWLTMAKVRRRRVSWRCEDMEAGRWEREPAIVAWIDIWLGLAGLELKGKSFRAPSAPEPPFSVWPEKRGPKRGHPAWRLPPIHGRQVREAGPGFSTAHPCAGEKESASCRFPLRGLSSPPHRRTGAPGRAARHRGAHSVRHDAQWRKSQSHGPSP